jgi:hypothetical protein
MTPVLVVVDPYRPRYNYYECPFTNQTTGISAALIAYNVRSFYAAGDTTSNSLSLGPDMRIMFDNCLEDEEAEESRLQRVKNHCLLG